MNYYTNAIQPKPVIVMRSFWHRGRSFILLLFRDLLRSVSIRKAEGYPTEQAKHLLFLPERISMNTTFIFTSSFKPKHEKKGIAMLSIFDTIPSKMEYRTP